MKKFRRITILFVLLVSVFIFSFFYENTYLDKKVLISYRSQGIFKEVEFDVINKRLYFFDKYPDITVYDINKDEVEKITANKKKCVNISKFPLKSYFLSQTSTNTKRVIFEYLDRSQEYYGYVLNPLWENGKVFYTEKSILTLNKPPLITDEVRTTISKVNKIEDMKKQELVKERFILYSVPAYKDDFKYSDSNFIIYSEIDKQNPDNYESTKIDFQNPEKYNFFTGSILSKKYIFANFENNIVQLKKDIDKNIFNEKKLDIKGNIVEVLFGKQDIYFVLEELDGTYLMSLNPENKFKYFLCDKDTIVKKALINKNNFAFLFEKNNSNIISIYNKKNRSVKRSKTIGNIVPSSFKNIFMDNEYLYYDEQIDNTNFEFCRIKI